MKARVEAQLFYNMEYKTYSKSRIELRDLQILHKMLEKSSELILLSSEHHSEPKKPGRNLEYCKNSKKPAQKTCSCVTGVVGHLIQALNERSVSGGGDLCRL